MSGRRGWRVGLVTEGIGVPKVPTSRRGGVKRCRARRFESRLGVRPCVRCERSTFDLSADRKRLQPERLHLRRGLGDSGHILVDDSGAAGVHVHRRQVLGERSAGLRGEHQVRILGRAGVLVLDGPRLLRRWHAGL